MATSRSSSNISPRRPIAPTAVDLFCGCGGLTTGLKSAGINVIGAADIDPLSAETYKLNHPDVLLWEVDITKLNPQELLEAIGLGVGELDLLAGCPPCQGYSTIRTLNKAIDIDDPRNNLVLEFARFVEAVLPHAVLMENVLGAADDRRFEALRRKLEEIGYRGSCYIVDAADYGVPQRRRRLIYMAGRGFEIPLPAGNKKRTTVREAIGNLPKAGLSGDPLHDTLTRHIPRIMNIIRSIPKDGGGRSSLPKDMWLERHKRCDGFYDAYGRMAWDDVAPTITGGCCNPSKGRFLHPEEDRAMTLREAALLQGFPRWYRFPVGNGRRNKTAVAAMIGNAVPPPLAAALGESIKKALNK